MPELPEVETVRRGIAPMLEGALLLGAVIRDSRLRWPVPLDLDEKLRHRRAIALTRRGKYLLVQLDSGNLVIHLGMSGSLRLVQLSTPLEKHDHVDILLEDGHVLRYRDPRRFGAILWSECPADHPLLVKLGVEPLTDDFNAGWLHQATRKRRTAIKNVIMDAHTVVGIGNIYANEALFRSGIHPASPAYRLSLRRCQNLVSEIKATLSQAINAGGSTLRDFVDSHGNPGYFQQTYFVYGRDRLPCRNCADPIQLLRQGNRATFFCPTCQKR